MRGTYTTKAFVRDLSAHGYALDGDWDTIAFLAEFPTNPYLIDWGWWDR